MLHVFLYPCSHPYFLQLLEVMMVLLCLSGQDVCLSGSQWFTLLTVVPSDFGVGGVIPLLLLQPKIHSFLLVIRPKIEGTLLINMPQSSINQLLQLCFLLCLILSVLATVSLRSHS